MLGDGFQYYVQHFLTFSDFEQMFDLGPLIYCRNISNNIRQSQIMLTEYYLCKIDDLKSSKLWKCCIFNLR